MTHLFLIALFVRAIAAVGLQYGLDHHFQREFLILGDANGYWELAEKISRGEDYAVYTPPRYVMRMPGFPAILAFSITLFGNHLLAARLFLAALTSTAVFPIYWLGQRAGGERVARIAALLVALHPVYVLFSVVILTECCFAAAICWSLWASDRWAAAIKAVPWNLPQLLGMASLAGLFFAIGVYLKPSWILFPPALSLAVFAAHSRRDWSSLLMATVPIVVMLFALIPWGIRNQQVSGHFTITTYWLGPSLYDSLNPTATGESDMTFFERDQLLERMSEYEMNRHYRDLAVEFVRNEPLQALWLSWVKLLRFWNPMPNAAQFQNFFLGVGCLLLSAAWVLCTAWGAVHLLDRKWLLFLLIGPILYFTAIHLVFVGSIRYRLPAEYPACVVAAIGISSWLSSLNLNQASKNREGTA